MVHFLLVTMPAQGHINPTLQFAKSLIRTTSAQVTFATTVYAHRRMRKPTTITDGLSYASFSDGYDDGFKPTDDPTSYIVKVKELGSPALSQLILTLANERRPVTCVVYTMGLAWVDDVATSLDIPSVLLWIQPAALFAVYYHYFHGFHGLINNDRNAPTTLIELPGLPLLTLEDLPSFLLGSNPSTETVVLASFKEQFETLDQQPKPTCVLVNTFDALEGEALMSVDGMEMVGIGPLVPSAFLDGKDPSDTSYGGDLFGNATYYIEWLDSKPKASVVYVSFGSLAELPKPQMEEILRGLEESNRPFLCVARNPKNDTDISDGFGDRKGGLVVPWCSQVEVLSHPSVGCFVTHCGWNSSIESLVMGVPVVGFPQWSDQATNAKLMEGFWKNGVRARVNKDGVLEGDELRRCLDLVMGDEEGCEEMRKNCVKWRDLAREAVSGGGSSDRNIREFVREVNEGPFSKLE